MSAPWAILRCFSPCGLAPHPCPMSLPRRLPGGNSWALGFSWRVNLFNGVEQACWPGQGPLSHPTPRVRDSALCPSTEGTLRTQGLPSPLWWRGGCWEVARDFGLWVCLLGGMQSKNRPRAPTHTHRPGRPCFGASQAARAAGPRLVVTSGGASSLSFVRSGSVCVEVLGGRVQAPHEGGSRPTAGGPGGGRRRTSTGHRVMVAPSPGEGGRCPGLRGESAPTAHSDGEETWYPGTRAGAVEEEGPLLRDGLLICGCQSEPSRGGG